MPLDKRVYVCKKCNNGVDRDYNSADNMENEGLKQVGAVHIELTPVEIEANTSMFLRYFNSIPYVKASSVNESGSFTALA
jgi:transposase